MSQYKTYNDLVYGIAKRIKELGDENMRGLRFINAYDCDNEHQMKQKDYGKSRGDLMEEIILEEFIEEFDRDIEE